MARYTDDDAQALYRRYLAGESLAMIAATIPCPRMKLSRLFKARGLPARSLRAADHVRDRAGRNGRARLTEAQVREIRARAAGGERQRALAAEYGVSEVAVSEIVRRKKWARVK